MQRYQILIKDSHNQTVRTMQTHNGLRDAQKIARGASANLDFDYHVEVIDPDTDECYNY